MDMMMNVLPIGSVVSSQREGTRQKWLIIGYCPGGKYLAVSYPQGYSGRGLGGDYTWLLPKEITTVWANGYMDLEMLEFHKKLGRQKQK